MRGHFEVGKSSFMDLPQNAIVRIRSRANEPIGIGFLVSEKLILTCAHVIKRAVDQQDYEIDLLEVKNDVNLDFPFLPSRSETVEIFPATVVFILPEKEMGDGDIALLELKSAPSASKPMPLVSPVIYDGYTFESYGVPEGMPKGIWVKGKILNQIGGGLIQLESESEYRIRGGFSGGPVWVNELNGAVGIVSLSDESLDDIKTAGARVGFAIPSKTLKKTIPSYFKICVQLFDNQRQYQRCITNYINCPFLFRRNKFFVGREGILDLIINNFRYSNRVVLSGLGGIGKTSIAMEYAIRNSDKYKTIMWVSAGTEKERRAWESDFNVIARHLNIEQRKSENNIKVIQNWLKNNSGWLLIIDGVEEKGINLLDRYTDAALSGHILVTDREPVADSIPVELLSLDESTEFLLRRLRINNPSDSDRFIAQKICQELGQLPIALEQAGAYIWETQCSMLDYLDAYCKERNERILMLSEYSESMYNPYSVKETVATTWLMSLNKIQGKSLAAMEILKICALSNPEIPEELIKTIVKYLEPDIQKSMDSFIKYNAVIREIINFSFIKRDQDTKTINIHKLVQEVVRSKMTLMDQEKLLSKLVIALNGIFPDVTLGEWDKCDRLLRQALFLIERIKESKELTAESTQLFNKTGVYLFHRAQFKDAEELFRYILNDKIYANSSIYADTAINLAELLEARGEYNEGQKYAIEAYKIFENFYSVASLQCANCNRVFGMIYQAIGKNNKAELSFKNAYKTLTKILGNNSLQVAESLNDLGRYYSTTGQLNKSIDYHEKARNTREKLLPSNHPDIAQTYSNIGSVYFKKGEISIAFRYFQRALDIWKKAYNNEKHPDLAFVLNNLALCHIERNDYQKAEALLLESISILESYGFEHPKSSDIFNNIGYLHHIRREYKLALEFYHKALIIGEETFGNENIYLAEIVNNIAVVYYLQKKFDEAAKYFQRLLTLQKNAYGEEHEATINTLVNLSLSFKNGEKPTNAMKLEKRALAISKNFYGEEAESYCKILQRLRH